MLLYGSWDHGTNYKTSGSPPNIDTTPAKEINIPINAWSFECTKTITPNSASAKPTNTINNLAINSISASLSNYQTQFYIRVRLNHNKHNTQFHF